MYLLKNKYLVASAALLITLYGCKKVIDVNLNNATLQTVITGEVNNRPGPYKITIARTVDFNANNDFPPVSGAFVTITGNGLTDTLSETGPGIYSTHHLRGKPGERYSLYASAEGKVYTATSVMPEPVFMDSITFLSGQGENIYAVANFQDPPEVANYYQFTEYINDLPLSNGRGNSVFNDRLSDGRYISRLLYNDSSAIQSGIVLTIQMKCIDQPVFNYLQELFQITGSGSFSSPAPDNPTSNISGGALGYFSANTVTSKSLKLP